MVNPPRAVAAASRPPDRRAHESFRQLRSPLNRFSAGNAEHREDLHLSLAIAPVAVSALWYRIGARWSGAVHERCTGCNLRFQRSDGHYFFGAMFFGVLLGELLFAVTFGIIVFATWPNVPWSVLQWMLPAGILVAAPLFIPFSKVAFLSVDVLVRPATPNEFT